ncbi:MAG: type II secretion system F family protein [Deltaproteobacteria bacterium]|nr:type II secretion system F family protein [Deltaproteobacteria bacterium]
MKPQAWSLHLRHALWQRKHGRRVERDLAQFLDLIAMTLEAGIDFLSAIAVITPLLRPGKFKEASSLFLEELKRGKPRQEAIEVWRRSLPLPSMHQLVYLIQQSWRTGGPLGRLLRLQASQLRAKRRKEAERHAAKMPFIALIPLLFFILPSALIIILMPLFLKIQMFFSQL